MTIETMTWDGVDLPFFIGIDEYDQIMGDNPEEFGKNFRIRDIKKIVWAGIRGGCIETGAQCDLFNTEAYDEREIRGLVNRNMANIQPVLTYWSDQGSYFSGNENSEPEKKPQSTARRSKKSASGTA